MKSLVTIPERCTGCHRCELSCSLFNFKVQNPALSRIHVIRKEPYVDVPIVCIQCGICIDACPIKAIKRNTKTGAVIIDEKKCNGCLQCVNVCPWGCITMDRVTRKIPKALKCNLCLGDPQCVKNCPEKVLLYVDVEEGAYYRRLLTAKSERKEPVPIYPRVR